ncbi:MAG: DUF4352 domain-containing protein [Clostridium sp.]
MKHKFITGLAILFLLVGIGSASSTPEKVGEDKPSTEANKKPEANKSKSFNVGDIVKLNDFNFTVNKVYTVKGNEFTKPKSGNEYIAIDCTVENISSTDQSISSIMMFKVVDKDGRACEYSIMGQTAANAGQLDGTIGAGRKLTGVYVVEVPKGQTGLEMEFNGSLFSGGQIIVNLN